MVRFRRSSLARASVLVLLAFFGATAAIPHDAQQRGMSLRALGDPATSTSDGALAVMRSPGDQPDVLQLDDGSAEAAFGITNNPPTFGNQGVFLNRFTIPDELLPFTIDTVSILFPVSTSAGSTDIIPGSTFEMLIYVDETASGNPDVTELKVRRSFAVQPSNTVFQEISTGTPLTIQSGDVWVGFTNTVTSVDNLPTFPAAADFAAPQGRSWAFFNDDPGSHFDGGALANAEIAQIGQLNWLIRATGQRGGSTCIRWDAPSAGRGDALPPPTNTRLCATVPPVKMDEDPYGAAAVKAYNVYRSNTPGVQPTPANFLTSVPPTQTSTGSSVSPGGSFFVVTAVYDGGESEPSDEFAIVPPTISSLKVKPAKLVALGVNFTDQVSVFVDGIPFVSGAAVKKNRTKVLQKGTLLTGQTLDQYLTQNGNSARIDFRNSNGALRSLDFSR